jgi:hypothetical protein
MSRSTQLACLLTLALASARCTHSNGAKGLPMPPPAEEPPLSMAATTGPDAGADRADDSK